MAKASEDVVQCVVLFDVLATLFLVFFGSNASFMIVFQCVLYMFCVISKGLVLALYGFFLLVKMVQQDQTRILYAPFASVYLVYFSGCCESVIVFCTELLCHIFSLVAFIFMYSGSQGKRS